MCLTANRKISVLWLIVTTLFFPKGPNGPFMHQWGLFSKSSGGPCWLLQGQDIVQCPLETQQLALLSLTSPAFWEIVQSFTKPFILGILACLQVVVFLESLVAVTHCEKTIFLEKQKKSMVYLKTTMQIIINLIYRSLLDEICMIMFFYSSK